MKKRIDVIASEEAYTNLSRFEELEDLNKTVRAHRDLIRMNVTRSDVQARLITLLELLKRHSCKQIGVSYMCKNTIAEKLEVSYKTVQRLMSKLESLGLIKQIATKRKSDMRQTANAIIIIPFIVEEEVSDKTPSEIEGKCPTKKTNSISLKQNLNNKNIRNSETRESEENSKPSTEKSTIEYFDYSYVSSNVPVSFIDSVRPFFNNATDIYRLWSRLKLAAKKSNVDVYEQLDSFIKTFKETVFNIKRNRNRKDVIGYVYGAWRNTAAVISRRLNNKIDWLEDCL